MLILHPYAGNHPEREVETWALMRELEQRYKVVHARTVLERDYSNFVATYWGDEDIIIIEGDMVPTLEDVLEIARCPETHCAYPYAISFFKITTMRDWTQRWPNSLGCVKFTKEVQLGTPA